MLGFLDGITQATASIRKAMVVAAKGGGIHSVRNFCNEQPYDVGTALPVSFAPGTPVLLASGAGGVGELIVAGPPPGSVGGASFPGITAYRSGSYSIPDPVLPTNCPVLITGKSYLAIFLDTGTNDFFAWSYEDGAYVEDAGPSVDYTGQFQFGIGLATFAGAQRIHGAASETVIFRASSPSSSSSYNRIVTWDIEAGTLAVLDTTLTVGSNKTIAGPIWPGSGTTVYFVHCQRTVGVETTFQLYGVEVGASGTMVPASQAIGSPLTISGGTYQVSASSAVRLIATALDLQVPVITTLSAQAIPYTDYSGNWNDGAGRSYTSGSEWIYGLPVDGDRSLLGAKALMAAGPSSPSLATFGASAIFGASSIGRIAISPSGGEFTIYPAHLDGEPSGEHWLYRIAVPEETIDSECDDLSPRIDVEQGPNTEFPTQILCRD